MFSLRFLILAALLAAPLFSQETLTLNEAWHIARDNNLTLQQIEKSILQANEEIEIRRAAYLPSLDASGSFFYISDIPNLQLPINLPDGPAAFTPDLRDWYNFSLGLSQPIFTGFRTKNLVKSARERHQASIVEKDAAQNKLFLEVGVLFYDLQLNMIQQNVLQESIRRADIQLQNARNLFLADQSAAFDTLEAANRKLMLQTELLAIENAFDNKRIKFRHLLNVAEPIAIERAAVTPSSTIAGSLEENLVIAANQRPELQQLGALQKAQLYQGNAAESAFYPQIFANLSMNTLLPGISFLEQKWTSFFVVSVGFQWNIWNWKQDHRRVQQSRLEMNKLDLQTRQILQNIRQQVTEVHQLLQNTREQIHLQKQLVAQQKERYRIASALYQEGQVTNLDISAAETALTESELRLQQSYIRWQQLRLQLDFATGSLGKHLDQPASAQ